MVPSLIDELARPYLAEIEALKDNYSFPYLAEIEALKDNYSFQKDEIDRILRLSRAYENYGTLLLQCGHRSEAFPVFVEAARVCLRCTTGYWENVDDERYILCRPLRTRFYTVYDRCKHLLRQYPELKLMEFEAYLDADYKTVTQGFGF